jgi:hypothetical protein
MAVHGRSSTPVPLRSVSRLMVIVLLYSGDACGYGDFEATTVSGLRPLLAILTVAHDLQLCASFDNLPSIIYRRVFWNCLYVTVRGWSSTPVPPGTVLLPITSPRVKGEPDEEGSTIGVDGAR